MHLYDIVSPLATPPPTPTPQSDGRQVRSSDSPAVRYIDRVGASRAEMRAVHLDPYAQFKSYTITF